LRVQVPELADVVTHIEPVGDNEARRAVVRVRSSEVREAVEQLARQLPGVKDCHRISVYQDGNDLSVSFHATMSPNLPIGQANQLTVQLESLLRAGLPELGRIVIHVEPPEVQDQ
jgi:divalent metal cation (Fe/Co/Zn/Cd) transporter